MESEHSTGSSVVSLNIQECPDPLQRGLPVRFAQKFVPLGKTVRVESNDPRVIEAATQSFGPFGNALPSAEPVIVIRLLADPVATEKGVRPLPVYRGHQQMFHIACGGVNFAVADLKTGTAIGFVSSEILSDRSFFREVFLECLFHVLVVNQTHTPVHAACVASKGRGVLIGGPSGAGKTTLAYACAKAGMQVISDDVVHLEWDLNLRQMVLWGNPWQLKLPPAASQWFPELSGRKTAMRSDGELYFAVETRLEFSGQANTSCDPAALVFLERTHSGALECAPLPAEVALARLREDIVLDDEAVVERHFDLLRRLVQKGTYTLRYPGAPTSAVGAIDKLLNT